MTLAWLLARNGHASRILVRTTDEAREINVRRRAGRAPSLELPLSVVATTDERTALHGVDVLLVAVPSQSVRANARVIQGAIAPGTPVIHATKGLERGTGKRVSEMLLEELPQLQEGDLCVLSGPNLASEIARGLPAATVVAGKDRANVQQAQALFHSHAFRVYASDDLAGVELAGSLKNVVAITAGIADGLAVGDNGKAAIITRALAEMTRLGVAAGAAPATFAGLAGVGDVIATCFSPLSRNRGFGEAIARGATVGDALAASRGVVEGIEATAAACDLARRFGVEMPIAESLREVILGKESLAPMIARLLEREPTKEA